jgi:hypothetical protein
MDYDAGAVSELGTSDERAALTPALSQREREKSKRNGLDLAERALQ